VTTSTPSRRHPSVHLSAVEMGRRHSIRGGFILFLFSESMLFVTLFASRFLYAGLGHPDLDQVLPAAQTFLLLVSVVLIRSALVRWRREPDSGAGAGALVRPWWGAVAVGALVTGGIVVEWARIGIPVGSTYGQFYYFALGLHLLHFVAGVLMVVAVAVSAQRRALPSSRATLVECTALFWYYVVGLWAAVWVVFYLL